MKYFRKDWILYQEVANEGGKKPEALIEINLKEDDVETNKHVPFIEEIENGYHVKVGKNEFHAVDNDHHIMFIELFVDDKYAYKQYLKTGDKAEATFNVPKGKKITAITFCNLHGMFKNSL